VGLSIGFRNRVVYAGVISLALYALGSATDGTTVPVAAAQSSSASTFTLTLAPEDVSITTANAIQMKFDLSALPAGAVVTDATLRMAFVDGAASVDASTITASKLLGRGLETARLQPSLSPPYDPLTDTVTDMVQEWLADPASNFGMLLNVDASQLTEQPVLQLDYVIPQRQQILTPQERDTANGIQLKFDLSTLPAGAIVHQATLRMALVGSDVAASNTYRVAAHKIIGTTPELDLAAGYRSVSPAYDTRAIDPAPGYKVWTLTEMVQEWIADPATNFGVLLNAEATRDQYRAFGTVDNADDDLRPALLVFYSLAANNQTLAPLEDTYLNVDKKNYSSSGTLNTYTWPNKKIANATLMQFDLSGLPKGAVIEEALLHLSLLETDAEAEKIYTVTVHKLRKKASLASATGFTTDGSTPWTTNNCCNGGAPMAQSDISGAYDTRSIDKAKGVKVWTLTKMVQEWVADPGTNYGLLLNPDASMPRDRWRFFASKNASDASRRPYLSIAYSLPTDTTAPVISGVASSNVTMSSATIRWTTDEASDSQVEYGATTSYGSTTTVDSNRVTSHAVTINGLSQAKPYHYRVRSRDAAGNTATSANFTFTTPDGTAPTVSITAPAAGATVSGTITVSANASDSAGVAGVQFRLDGASLGAEDTTAPYSVSWNTTTASAGSHTLSAVARDPAGNTRTSAAVTVTVSNASAPPPPPPTGTISSLYPGDAGIESHPDVMLVERFEEAAVSNVLPRWTDVLNGGAMSLSTDVPAGSAGTKSLNIPWTGGGVSNGGHLFKQLAGVDGTVYVRYYIKYPTNDQYDHTGIWMGGSNPATPWPNPQAGTKPAGDDRFIAAAEQSESTGRFDHYNYWMNMRRSGDGNYWGNLLLNNPNVQANVSQWMCVEHMVKLNDPASSNGEHAIWIDGVKVSHLGPGFPNGSWSGGIFTQSATGSPFEGFRWRSDSALKLNWIWLQVYAPDSPAGVTSSVKFDHVVLAKSHIGCLTPASTSPVPPPPPPPPPPPAGWPNEPAGMTLLSDWGLDQVLPTSGDVPIVGSGGWKIVENASVGSSQGWATRALDAGAPSSPSNVYDFVYPAGMIEGVSPAAVYYDGFNADEIYVGFWWKPSSPFDTGPNGNKIAFIFNGGGDTGGQQFLILYPDGRLHVLPEYPGDYRWRTPNVNATVVQLGVWHRVEWYTNRVNGTLKWWLDGVLQGSYTNVTNPVKFDMFQFNPTWGGNIGARKTQTDHYWFDHAHLSKR
jgi:hypothetical protein